MVEALDASHESTTGSRTYTPGTTTSGTTTPGTTTPETTTPETTTPGIDTSSQPFLDLKGITRCLTKNRNPLQTYAINLE